MSYIQTGEYVLHSDRGIRPTFRRVNTSYIQTGEYVLHSVPLLSLSLAVTELSCAGISAGCCLPDSD